MKLNKFEFATGFVISFAWSRFMPHIIIAIEISLLSGLLWALGGTDGLSKAYRRLGCPIIICVMCAIGQWSLLPLLSIPFVFGSLTIGYGIPSWNNPDGSMDDEGSTLGRFWYRLINGKLEKTDKNTETLISFFTRLTYGAIIALGMFMLGFSNTEVYFKGLVYCMIWVGIIDLVNSVVN